ncbi:hypothetical protein BR93DRAFT_975669 [Coniochaeta sp. PMI_546]|nr:hypothetical protein BR93DRAFT_975669 [Coniochaeta sp. PMI_546]
MLSNRRATRQDQQQQRDSANEADDLDFPGDDGGRPEPTAAIACNGCRKRKLRCSRELPTCQHCRRTAADCEYEAKKNKPGLKPGALEKVHRRLDNLERVVHKRQRETQESRGTTPEPEKAREKGAYDILALLARELPKLVMGRPECDPNNNGESGVRFGTGPRKRRQMDHGFLSRQIHGGEEEEEEEDVISSPCLPPSDCLEAVLRAYFACIHPWIPMVHQARLRARLADPVERPKLNVLLYAMVLAASRFVDNQDLVHVCPSRLRGWVVSNAMDCMSVESLQAIIIIAFNDIGNGESFKAWSLVGSMTRTVEYLQLTVEHEDHERQPLSQPFMTLLPTDDWTEKEERRRVFWTVFNHDRFCSVTMGWSTSLTSDDVHRRLPCDGILWRKQEPVTTPFFGIWDKAAARIGNPIAFPSQVNAPDIATDAAPGGADLQGRSHSITSAKSTEPGDADMTNVGAFAYCIEATESMSRVTSHFLQQRINPRDKRDIRLWLTRFKEIDLRLVHWKMLLPQRWKADSYLESRAATPLVMDPNLTLAHVTHNTSMILLHQLIAFPPPEWAIAFRNAALLLPSACSADTCLAAATEIAAITTKYLRSTPAALPVANQYAFCVYIAARVLLVYWRSSHAEAQLRDDYWTLVQALEEFSDRWCGLSSRPVRGPTVLNMARKYATRLRDLHGRCLSEEGFRVNVAAYTTEIDYMTTTTAEAQSRHRGNQDHEYHFEQDAQPATRRLVDPGFGGRHKAPVQMQMQQQPGASPMTSSTTTGGSSMVAHGSDVMSLEEILGVTPQSLLDQEFMDLDRIISFDDGTMFAATLDGSGGGW